MPAPKGNNYSPGRPKGVPNKNTMMIKEAYRKLLEDNLDNMSVWLAQIASENPDKAVDLMLKLSEYLIPKLARTETSLEGGLEIKDVRFKFGDDKEE